MMQAFLHVVVLLGLSLCITAVAPPQQLYDCVNENYPGYQYSMFEDFASMKPSRMKLQQAWWSGQPARVNLTVVTALTLSRLDQLRAQCESWHGPLSAAVYLALIQPREMTHLAPENQKQIDDGVVELERFHAEIEALHACQLDVTLVYEVVGEDIMLKLLPINSIRNYAMLMARTALVSMIDVDLLVSKSLFNELTVPEKFSAYVSDCKNKKLFILPAFETAYNANATKAYILAAEAVATNKAGAKDLMDRGLIFQFALPIFWTGHGATNFAKWLTSTAPYTIKYQKMFEPWFIIDRLAAPAYDSRFRGYGWNKVTQVSACAAAGWEFVVHPNAFIVHRQHTRSSAGKVYFKTKSNPALKQSLFKVVEEFKALVFDQQEKNTYVPLVDFAVSNCRQKLPWWQGPAAGAV